MKVIGVHLCPTEQITTLGGERSGFMKQAVASASVTELGLVGDSIVSTEHHGGPDQAVYVYTADDYAWWAAELGETLDPGHFGENLTIDTVGADPLRIGDRFAIGDDVILEVTGARIPCAKFADRMNRPQWVRTFRAGRRPGFYARVVRIGDVSTGDEVRRSPARTDHIEMLATMDLFYDTRATVDQLDRALASPIDERARKLYQRRRADQLRASEL